MANRPANVPRAAAILDEYVSKADLLEIAYSLASLLNDAGSCDDEASTVARMLEEINTFRAFRKVKPLDPAKIARIDAARIAKARARWDAHNATDAGTIYLESAIDPLTGAAGAK